MWFGWQNSGHGASVTQQVTLVSAQVVRAPLEMAPALAAASTDSRVAAGLGQAGGEEADFQLKPCRLNRSMLASPGRHPGGILLSFRVPMLTKVQLVTDALEAYAPRAGGAWVDATTQMPRT